MVRSPRAKRMICMCLPRLGNVQWSQMPTAVLTRGHFTTGRSIPAGRARHHSRMMKTGAVLMSVGATSNLRLVRRRQLWQRTLPPGPAVMPPGTVHVGEEGRQCDSQGCSTASPASSPHGPCPRAPSAQTALPHGEPIAPDPGLPVAGGVCGEHGELVGASSERAAEPIRQVNVDRATTQPLSSTVLPVSVLILIVTVAVGLPGRGSSTLNLRVT